MFARDLRMPLLTGFVAANASVAAAAIPGSFSTLDPDPGVQGTLGMTAGADLDLVPAFRAGERNRLHGGLEADWYAAERVVMDAHWQVLADLHPDGSRVVGPGDLELGLLLRLPLFEASRERAREAGGRGPSVGLGWRVKLPNAADEGELGSDETDLSLVASCASDLGPLRGWLGAGLAILGDPLMLAAQDDVPFFQAQLSFDTASQLQQPWLPMMALGVDLSLPSASNPSRGLLGASLAWGQRWRLVLDGAMGLTRASPVASLQLGFQRRFWAPGSLAAGDDGPVNPR